MTERLEGEALARAVVVEVLGVPEPAPYASPEYWKSDPDSRPRGWLLKVSAGWKWVPERVDWPLARRAERRIAELGLKAQYTNALAAEAGPVDDIEEGFWRVATASSDVRLRAALAAVRTQG